MSNKTDLDRLLQSFVDGGLPCCGLKITRRGETVYEGYFGCADVEAKTPLTAQSVFRQASTSKLPLYTAALMLYEKGMFLLSDPLYEYLPEYRESRRVKRLPDGGTEIVKTERPLIVKDILTMRCGLPYCNFPVETDDPTVKGMVEAMRPLWAKGHYTNREQVRQYWSERLKEVRLCQRACLRARRGRDRQGRGRGAAGAALRPARHEGHALALLRRYRGAHGDALRHRREKPPLAHGLPAR